MNKQDKTKLATLQSNNNIAITVLDDIREICFAALNEGMNKQAALRSIVMVVQTGIDWIDND
jgi:hypothetical protein